MRETTKKVILKLKEVRTQKNLTYQDILEACEAQHEAVSLSTIKRIFAKGSEDGQDYRDYTVNAIFRAIVGTEETELSKKEEEALTDTAKEVVTENAALKAVVEMHDATIEDLNSQISLLKTEKETLESIIKVMQVKLDTTTDLFRLAMESLGKSASH